MRSNALRGRVYRCPVCGAELTVLGSKVGRFKPRCCNTDMELSPGKLQFYICPVCGAEVALLGTHADAFAPRCCNTAMLLEAA